MCVLLCELLCGMCVALVHGVRVRCSRLVSAIICLVAQVRPSAQAVKGEQAAGNGDGNGNGGRLRRWHDR